MSTMLMIVLLALFASATAFFGGMGRSHRTGSKLSMASSFGVQKLGKYFCVVESLFIKIKKASLLSKPRSLWCNIPNLNFRFAVLSLNDLNR